MTFFFLIVVISKKKKKVSMLLLRLSDALSNKIIKDKPPLETSASECFDLKRFTNEQLEKNTKKPSLNLMQNVERPFASFRFKKMFIVKTTCFPFFRSKECIWISCNYLGSRQQL